MRTTFFYRLLSVLPFLLFLTQTSLGQSQHCLANRYSQDALFDSTDIQITTSVHFATSMRWPSTVMDSLRMDVYMPNPNIDPLEKRPLIVMIHGGAFLAGNRNDMALYSMEMARRGFVTATISYRLGWDCPAQDFLGVCTQCQDWPDLANFRVAMYRGSQDTRAALRYLTSFANDYGIDTSAVFLQGESAGSINALHTAFLEQSEADAWCTDCVTEVGLLDTTGNSFGPMPNIKGVVNNCGAVGLISMVQPGSNIPVIGFHDDNDIIVPYGYGQFVNCLIGGNGSNSIRVTLQNDGVCTQMNTVVHLPFPFDVPAHCSYPRNAVIGKASCFLKDILCNDCSSSTTTQIWNVPDCSAGGFVSIEENQQKDWVNLNGNRLQFNANSQVNSVQVYDISMRLLVEIPVNGSSEVQLPTSLRGCMFVKIDAKNHATEMLKWCNF